MVEESNQPQIPCLLGQQFTVESFNPLGDGAVEGSELAKLPDWAGEQHRMAENFQGKGDVAGSWPRGEQPLSRSERLELQERLVAQGFDPGTPDGIIGANTRKAIRGFQQRLGWPADGHPTQELLGRLRAHN